jgi:hypothetical protein
MSWCKTRTGRWYAVAGQRRGGGRGLMALAALLALLALGLLCLGGYKDWRKAVSPPRLGHRDR